MKKKNALALGVLMSCLIVGNIGHAKVYGREDVNKNDWKNIELEDSAFTNPSAEKFYNSGENILDTNITSNGKRFGVLSYNTAVLDIIGTNISVDAKNVGTVAGVAADTISYFEKNNSGSDALKQFTDGGTINLGTSDTNTINITATSQTGSATGIECIRSVNDPNKNGGIFAEPSFVNVKGENLIINAHSDKNLATGIWAQNNTGDINNPSTITIDAKNTIINSTSGITEPDKASGEYYNIGIVAYSSSKVIINNNLTVNAGTAISTRGDATTIINKDGTGTVKINGDINFNYDKPTSGTAVDATVDINLTNAESYLNGNIFVNGNPFPPEGKDEVNAMQLALSNEAQWNTDADSFVNNLKLDGGIVNMKGNGQEVTIDNVNGSGTVTTDNLDNQMTIETKAADTYLTVKGVGEQLNADAVAQNKDLVKALTETVADKNGKTVVDEVAAEQGTILGEYRAEVGADGKIANGIFAVNENNQAVSNMASIALMAWRAENNDMNKRLGELRNSTGEHGVWARMMRGESKYGEQNVKNQYNTYQLGYDEKLSTDDHWTVGAAISYTDGQSSFANGSGENKHTGLSLYGSYLGDDGSFVDLIAKYARLKHDFDVNGGIGSGDYDTNGYSISAEYGKRFTKDNGFWLEPQAELTYGKVGSVSYMTDNGASVRQDGMDSIVGRLGIAAGKNIKNGNVYLRASYLYDFDGETSVTMSKGASTTFEQDLGGGWWEVGVGTNLMLSKATHLYFDLEKTYGGNVATPWQWNAGMRWSF